MWHLFSNRSPQALAATKVTRVSPLEQQLLQAVEHCYQVAEQHLQRSFPRPEVNFKLRGKAAGTAHLQLNKLRFHPVLLSENSNTFIREVVPHEVCHLLCHQLYGKVKPHGAEWKQLMQQLFQLPGNTTHQFDTTSVTPKGKRYRCACGEVELTLRRHNKIVRGQARYRCRHCGQWLQPAA
ncbi:SprT family zinc-dependent metalloprotease [Shewanella dokdonensis]|uniref:Protein SprT n=1 Tax=Shewanella dokdonensis TaxID=712036 RepID=A0ABX8DC64_9GAMM|nr:SprT family zinc-dependent metalloprotease [Shewanella dokdonensis]MCL1074644.1 SprT family zinc-dependent metalloprotease [Shewanella dokdonensis]QVK22359.1 SprT family zinc-dependent metalloprotease [Shewanella dokdonensis]